MNRPDREDAMARALDILPPGDPAASDPRMVRDEALTEEARATREAAADVWLAVSPLRAAPPEVLHSVMDKIGLPPAEKPVAKGRRLAPMLAASGWAAAAAVTICLWPRHASEGPRMAETTPREPATKATNRGMGGDAAGTGLNADAEYWRRQVVGMQKAMELMRKNELASLPRVLSLTTPGSPRRSPGESRQQMFQKMYQIVANSFRDQMDVTPNRGDDPEAKFVIERGYMQPGLNLANDEIVLRHRNFPEESWEALGLWRSPAGEYYDPDRRLMWTPDPAMGGFLGRRADANQDLAAFAQPQKPAEDLVQTDLANLKPEGFVLEDPLTRKAEVVIDQVPPPQEGHEQKIYWTDASGASGMIPVLAANSATPAGPNGNGAVYFLNGGNRYLVAGGGPFAWDSNMFLAGNSTGMASTVMASFSTTAEVTSFQLVEVPIGGGGAQTVIVQGGH